MNAPAWLLLLACFLLLLPVIVLRCLNLKRDERYKQLRIPAAALLVSVLCCAFFQRLSELVDRLMNLRMVWTLLNRIAPSGMLSYLALLAYAVLGNTLVFAVFIPVKLFARIGLRRHSWPDEPQSLNPAGRVWHKCVSCFYHPVSGRVVLRRGLVGVAYALRWAAWIIGVFCLLLVALLFLPVLGIDFLPFDFLRDSMDLLYLFPAITLLFVNEFRWYLGGPREYENPGKTVYDDSELRRFMDYGELAEQYKKQFPERFCAELDSRSVGTEKPFLNEAAAVEPNKSIGERLREEGFSVNGSYLTCLQHLFQRKSAMINASMFSDFGEYLFIYLNTLLARGDNVLFLCADEDRAAKLSRYVEEKFRQVNSFHPVWLIRDGEETHGTSDADVLVMSPRFVTDNNTFVGQRSFFNRLSAVILVDTAEIAARDEVAMTLLAHRLAVCGGNRGTREPQYICLSENSHPEISNSIKRILDLREELYVCDGYQSFEHTHLMLWNYEPARSGSDGRDTMAQDNLFGSSSQHYWGVSIPLACVGLKYGVERINIIARTWTPIRQIADNVKNQISRLTAYFGSQIGSGDFDRVLRLNTLEPIDPRSTFLIVEDDLFNLPLAVYNYSRFSGSETGMIHIVSKPYMLRDYFTANARRYLSREAKVDMILPAMVETRQLILTKILSEAKGLGIEANRLLAEVQKLDPEVKDLREAMRFCRDAFYPDGDELVEFYFSQRTETEFNPAATSFEERVYVRLKPDTPLDRIVTDTRLAKLDLRGQREELDVFANRIRQTFVTGQNFVHNGSIYRVVRLDEEEGVVFVTEASDRLGAPVDYIQVRKYTLKGEPAATDVKPVRYVTDEKHITNGYEIRLYHEADLSVDTLGYFALSSVNPTPDLLNMPDYTPFSKEERRSCFREYTGKTVLAFRIKHVGELMADKTSFLLAVMMNELLKTVFPYSYQCIAVCPNLTDPDKLLEKELDRRIASAYPQITVSENFRHDSDDVEVLLIEDCEADLGLLRTLLQNEHFPFSFFFSSILAYLNWYDGFSGSGNITNRYLHFGGEDMPDCFDPITLKEICSEFETVRRSDSISVELVSTKGRCSYCHRELVNVTETVMNDGAGKYNRRLCDRCASLIVRDHKQLMQLYKRTRRYLCDTFGITLPEDLNLHFATAATLRNRVKSGDKRVVVGLSDFDKRELWVESDAPPANVLDVLVHELTHFWQHENLDTEDLTVLEGQASYVEVQFMRSENYTELADWLDEDFRKRRDAYGKGYRLLDEELTRLQQQNSFDYMREQFGKKG